MKLSYNGHVANQGDGCWPIRLNVSRVRLPEGVFCSDISDGFYSLCSFSTGKGPGAISMKAYLPATFSRASMLPRLGVKSDYGVFSVGCQIADPSKPGSSRREDSLSVIVPSL